MQSTKQPLNSTSTQQSGDNHIRNRILLVIVIFAVTGLLIFLQANTRKSRVDTTGTYDDPASGETVSNPKDKAPEYVGSLSDMPLYLGFSKLLDYGITQDQLDGIKVAFSKYPELQDTNSAREVSIFVDTITGQEVDVEAPTQSISFSVNINRQKKMFATVSYSGLSNVQLYLRSDYKSDVVFDSGPIGTTEVNEFNDIGD